MTNQLSIFQLIETRQPKCKAVDIHSRENNLESESFLNENKAKLTRQCQKVLDLLKSGERLTVRTAMIEHGISSLPRRILDLKESGIEISHRWVTDQDGARKFKEWFILDKK